MSYMRTVPVIFFLFTCHAHAGICESFVSSIAKTAHAWLDKSGRSFAYARALNEVSKIAANRDSRKSGTDWFKNLQEIEAKLRTAEDVSADEKTAFFEEVTNIALKIADERDQQGQVAFEEGGMRAVYLWISRHAMYSAGRTQIQIRLVEAIRRLMNGHSRWYRVHLARLLIDMGSAAGFTPQAAELLDNLSLADKLELTDPANMNLYSFHAREKVQLWRPAVELESMREYLVPALNDYTLKKDLRNFRRFLDGHGHQDVSLDGPNGYNDRTPRIRADMLRREDKRAFINPLNAVLYQLFRYRIFYGIKNFDRVVRGEDKREPLFVKPAVYGALVIMSYMSQERKLSEAEMEERRELFKNLSGQEHGILLMGGRDVGSPNATAHFLAGHWDIDPLRDASAGFRKMMKDRFSDWEMLE